MPSPPGTLLSQRYEIRDSIGSDGILEVYRALDLRLGRDVAITVLEVHNLIGTDEYLRFEREAQARAALQHPRITTIHDLGHDATRIFLVAEWMEGESLRSRLRKGPLNWPQLRALGRELLDGLAAIHDKDFALGALSPASVFMEQDGHAKLFAYRLQKLGHTETTGPRGSDDLRSLAALLLQVLPPSKERHRMGRADIQILDQLKLWSEGGNPADIPTFATFKALLRERPQSRWRRRLPWLAALLVMISGGVTISLWRGPRTPPPITLALLPFKNLEGKNEADYLGPNLLHALANELGRTPGVKVALAGSTLTSSAAQDPALLARKMGADLALSGGYRLEKGQLSVEARILRARDGSTFSRCQVERPITELLFLASELEDQLRASLQGNSRIRDPFRGTAQNSQDLEAQRLCLHGLQLLGNMDPVGFQKALACFQSALARDPSFALAYSGLSDCYCVLGSKGLRPRAEAYRLAEAAARKALGLDPGLAQAHASLANVRFRFGLDWMGAEDEFRQALRLDPSYAKAHQWFGLFLATLGHWEESLEHMRRAVELEPLSLSCRNNYALDLHWAGRSQEALHEFETILDQEPTSIGALNTLWQVQEELGKMPEAIGTIKKLVALGGLEEKSAASLQNALEAQGSKGYWAQRVRLVEQSSNLDPVRLAEVVALQGDRDRAFRLLDRAIQKHSPFLIFIPKNPAFEDLRQDPRFEQLLRRIKYPCT